MKVGGETDTADIRPEVSDTAPDVLDAAAMIRGEADRYLALRIAALPRGGAEITCRRGCFACCSELVVVSPLEAHAIGAYIAKRPALAETAAGKCAEWEQRIAATRLAAPVAAFEAAEGYLPGNEGGELETDYWMARIPCPFLADGQCSIYPVRPFGCREHYVVSDPRLCAEELDAPTTAGTRMEYRAVANWVGTACYGLPDRLILLPRALRHAAENRDDGARRAPIQAFRDALAEAQRRARFALALLRVRARRR